MAANTSNHVERTIVKKPATWRRTLYPYLWFLPVLFVLFVAMADPWGWSLVISLHRWDLSAGLSPRFIGFSNYIDIVSDPLFHQSLGNSLWYMFVSVAFQFVFGFGIALLLNRELPLRRMLMIGIMLPFMLTPAMVGLVWKILMHGSWGVLNHFLRSLGLESVAWLSDPAVSLRTIAVISIWQHTPWTALILFAGLQAIPTELVESARADGANAFQSFIYITVPVLLPMIVIVLLFRVIFALRAFDVIYALFRSGGPGNAAMVLGVYLYETFRIYWELGRSSAISFIILGITLALSAVFSLRVFRSEN